MLKVGVFGVGHLGKFHLNNWKEIPGVELTGFYDPDDTNANEVTAKYGLKRFKDPADLLNKIDAADIVAPTDHHFSLCEKAIKKGKHVFVEKPLAQTMDEAHALVKLVKESNVKLQVGHVERFNPAFLAVKDLKLNPMFIEVHRLAQFNPRGTEVSVILDLMIHDIDIILSIVKSDVKFISASGVGVMTETPDIANVRIEFNNGCDANVFTFDIETLSGKKSIAISNPEIPEVNAIKKELEEFKNAIGNNTRTIVSEIDGLMAMDVAHQILQKIGNNVITR